MNIQALSVALIALLLVACGGQAGHEVQGAINVDNVAFLLTESEVEDHGRDGLDVHGDVIGFMDRAREGGAELENIEDWVGIDYAESVDGARLNFAVLDLIDEASADARFGTIAEEFLLVESEQGIGERFAGLAPKVSGVHTVVMFLVGDKVTVITTTVSLTDNQPLMESEQLVEIARLVAPRIIP
ncbi:MAG: hypothetical protein O2826_02795 [Chloroflexi bacterium]|nr:hypothetical protein [Chloroflexota bacterium]MDA1173428.1 hypothetical protein [Chloroflexota bacterium]